MFKKFNSWHEAIVDNKGYNSDIILQRVKESLLKVKRGEAVFERDSVLFDKIQYSWPVTAGLLWVASNHNNHLSVLDFGGSLGSCFFQNRLFLKHMQNLRWCIVEQENFVQCGREYFEDGILKFYSDFEACVIEQHPNVILFSGVLGYLPDPYEILNKALEFNIPYLIFDRTPFSVNDREYVIRQDIPADIYEASISSWVFSYTKFSKTVLNKYVIVTDFDSFDVLDNETLFRGFICNIRP